MILCAKSILINNKLNVSSFVIPDASIFEIIDVRADEQQILYSHTRPNGSNVLYDGQRYGFTFLDECLTDSLFRDSCGYQKSGEDIGQTMFDSWKSSSAHYNIMVRTTRQTHIGLSFVVNNGNTFRMYGVLLIGWN